MISAVAPSRTGLQLMMSTFIFHYLQKYISSIVAPLFRLVNTGYTKKQASKEPVDHIFPS